MNDNESSEAQALISSADLAKALSPFLNGKHPSEAFVQFDEVDVRFLFHLDGVKIVVRVPCSAFGFTQSVCILISGPLLFDYLSRVTSAEVLLRYSITQAVVGTSMKLSVVADEEITWPATAAETFVTNIPSCGEVLMPDKLAQAIDLTTRFVNRKSENGLRDDILLFGAGHVDAFRTEAGRTYQLSGMQPSDFSAARSTALTLASVCRGLTHGRSFCKRSNELLLIWDDRLSCEFAPTFTSTKRDFGKEDDVFQVVGAEFQATVSLALGQGGAITRKQYSLRFDKIGDDLHLNVEVQIPGAPIAKEGRAQAKCKIVPVDRLCDLPSGEVVLSDPQIRKVGMLSLGTVWIRLGERISFREADGDETLITTFSCRKFVTSPQPTIKRSRWLLGVSSRRMRLGRREVASPLFGLSARCDLC